MAKKLWVKTGVGSVFSEITNFYVKTSASGWSQITDAWVKTSVGATWSKFWEALMSPSQAVELIESYTGTNSDTLRFQGRNYKWTPTPQSLKYYFRWIPDGGSTYYVGASGSSGDTASNPTTSNLWPSSTTYITISPSGSNFELGKTNRYYFEVRATGASGTVYSSQSTEDVKIVSPKAPTITYTVASSTSVNLTITPASYEDWFATGRYIVYTYDITGGTITSGGGRGAVTAGSNPSTVTLTGLTPGRNYTVYALPVTGSSGTTPSNYSGYPGIEGYLSGVTTGSADPQAFTTISYVKNFPSSSSGGVVRTTTLSWNASTNATRYEIEYEGSYNNSTWTTVQSFAASPYTSSTSQSVSWGSPVPAGGFDYYTYMRARVRASNPDSSVNVIGDGGSYIYAAGVAPGQPSFGTITYNTAGTTASIPVTVGTAGSNYLYSAPIEYQYRESPFGSYSGTWTSSSTPISLTGLSPSRTYYIKIRTRNYDELVSPENETNFETPAALTKLATPTGVNATDARTDGVNVTWNAVSGAAYYGVWYGGAPGYNSLADFGGNRNTSLITGTSYLDTSLANGVTRDYYVQAYRSGDPTGTKSEWGGPDSGTRAAVVSIPSGGSVSLTGGSTAGSIITASTSGWSGSPTSYDVYITTALSPNIPTSSSSRVASSGGGSSTSYTITSSDAISPVNIFRAFATASNSAGTSGTVQSSNTITTTSSSPATAPGTPGTPTNGWTSGTSYPFSWTAPSAGTVSGGGAASISYYNLYIYEATNSSGSGYYQINSYTVYGTSFSYTSPNASLYYACQVSATNTAGLTGGISGFSPYK